MNKISRKLEQSFRATKDRRIVTLLGDPARLDEFSSEVHEPVLRLLTHGDLHT